MLTEISPFSSGGLTNTCVNRLRTSLSLQQPTGAWTNRFVYDAARRLTNVTSQAGSFGYVYRAGRLVKAIGFPGGCYITNTYDPSGMLLDTYLKNGSTVLNHHGYTYNQGFYRTNATRTDASHISYSYDNIGQLVKATAYDTTGTGTPRLNEAFGYGYDTADNLISRTNGVLTETFTPDNLNQLGSISRSGSMTVAGLLNLSPQANSLLVNGVGAAVYNDLTFATTNGVTLANGNNTFTASLRNSGGQALTNAPTLNLPASVSLYYDYDGNLTNDGLRYFEYDDADRVTAVTVSNAWRCEYTYDGLWRRRMTKQYGWNGSSWGSPSNEIHYVYEGMLPIQERNSANTPMVTYTRGLDLGGGIQAAGGIGGLLARTDANGAAFYHADGNGNITALINSAGTRKATYLYDPFGNMVAMSGLLAGPNTQRFSSKEVDTLTGQYSFTYRIYEPNLQRWDNRDPLGLAGGINLHRFVGNNPISRVDPYGLTWALFSSEAWWQLLSDVFIGDRPPTVVDPNSFIAQHGVDNNFNGETAAQVVGDIGKAVPEGILTAAMMLGGEGEAEGAYQAADKALKAAKNCPKIDPNKLRHIFDNARHDLGGLLSQFKSQEEAFAAIQGATEAAVQQQKLTGIFETSVQVGGQAITVRGNVVNGVVQIGTAFK